MSASRRIAALLTVVAVAFVVGGSGLARAGGPTSVLLVAGELGRTASLYYSNPDYQRLLALVKPPPDSSETTPSAAARSHEVGLRVSATWLIHDVDVWQVDHIYPEAPGGPWIMTVRLDGADSEHRTVRWHRAADPRGMLRLLANLDLLGPGPKVRRPASSPRPVPEPVPAEPVTSSPAVAGPVAAGPADSASAAGGSGFAGWPWSLPGLAAGMLFTALVLRVVPAWRRATPRRAGS